MKRIDLKIPVPQGVDLDLVARALDVMDWPWPWHEVGRGIVQDPKKGSRVIVQLEAQHTTLPTDTDLRALQERAPGLLREALEKVLEARARIEQVAPQVEAHLGKTLEEFAREKGLIKEPKPVTPKPATQTKTK